MKLKVLKSFNDKYTDVLYTEGQVLEVTEKRAKELLSHPLELVEVIEEDKEVKSAEGVMANIDVKPTSRRKTTKSK
jgi:hypothetical protein